MSRLKRLALVLAALVGGTLGAVVVASPASANWDPCPFGALCTYRDIKGGGEMYYYTYTPLCVEIGGTWDNDISSVWNNTGIYPNGWKVTMYRDHGCTNGFYSYTWNPGAKETVCSLWCFPDAYSSLYFWR